MTKKEILKELDVYDENSNVLKVKFVKNKNETKRAKETGHHFLYDTKLITFFAKEKNNEIAKFYKNIGDSIIGYYGGGIEGVSVIYSLTKTIKGSLPLLRITDGLTFENKTHFIFYKDLAMFLQKKKKFKEITQAGLLKELKPQIKNHPSFKELAKKGELIYSYGGDIMKWKNKKPTSIPGISLVFFEKGKAISEINLIHFENVKPFKFRQGHQKTFYVPNTILDNLEKIQRKVFTKDIKTYYNKYYENEIKQREPKFRAKKEAELLKIVEEHLLSLGISKKEK